MSDIVRPPHGSASCACLFCWHDIATLTADLAAERAERDSVETQCRHLRERIGRLVADLAAERAEVVRLRAAGDELAEALNEDMGDTTSGARITFALVEWQEARR